MSNTSQHWLYSHLALWTILTRTELTGTFHWWCIGQHKIFAVYLVNCLRPFHDFNHRAITMQSFLLLICMIHTGHDFGPKPRNSELIRKNHIPVISCLNNRCTPKCHFRCSYWATSVMQRWTFIILINLLTVSYYSNLIY